MGNAGFLLVGERGQSPFYPLSGLKFGRRYASCGRIYAQRPTDMRAFVSNAGVNWSDCPANALLLDIESAEVNGSAQEKTGADRRDLKSAGVISLNRLWRESTLSDLGSRKVYRKQ